MAVFTTRGEPKLRLFMRHAGMFAPVYGDAPMRARANADIIAAMPYRAIMATMMTGNGVIGNLISRQAGGVTKRLRDLIKRRRHLLMRHRQSPLRGAAVKHRVGLNGQLIKRHMLRRQSQSRA